MILTNKQIMKTLVCFNVYMDGLFNSFTNSHIDILKFSSGSSSSGIFDRTLKQYTKAHDVNFHASCVSEESTIIIRAFEVQSHFLSSR